MKEAIAGSKEFRSIIKLLITIAELKWGPLKIPKKEKKIKWNPGSYCVFGNCSYLKVKKREGNCEDSVGDRNEISRCFSQRGMSSRIRYEASRNDCLWQWWGWGTSPQMLIWLPVKIEVSANRWRGIKVYALFQLHGAEVARPCLKPQRENTSRRPSASTPRHFFAPF